MYSNALLRNFESRLNFRTLGLLPVALHEGFSRGFSSTPAKGNLQKQPESGSKPKLERIADELLSLTKLEKHDFSILFKLKLGMNRYASPVAGMVMPGASAGAGAAGATAAEKKVAEKTSFDVKLEKYDATAKIKIIKEVRSFTDLGLKEANDLVEKAPAILKKGLTKEEAVKMIEKLKELGATAVME